MTAGDSYMVLGAGDTGVNADNDDDEGIMECPICADGMPVSWSWVGRDDITGGTLDSAIASSKEGGG